LRFKVRHVNLFPKLPKDLEIDMYRVIQEFINNAMKHGEANKISIRFSYSRKLVKIILTENGKGFDNRQLMSKGMGLQNVRSRVKSHNGDIIISSEPGKGTKYIMTIPVNI
jgi:signal transduction histidine kinase